MPTLSLTDGITTVELSPDLSWPDEFSWKPVLQSVERGITGSLITESSKLIKGRSITLQSEQSGDVQNGWIQRRELDQINAWAEEPGQRLTLSLRGIKRNVKFRHHEGSAVEATPVADFNDPYPDDYYIFTLRLMEV